jgi:hypothetical protein
MTHIDTHRTWLLAMAVAAVLNAAGAMAQTAGGAASLPPPVLKAFQQAYPGATISAISQQREQGRTLHRVEAMDRGRRRAALYEAGGRLVETSEEVRENELPRPVTAAWRSHPRATSVTALKVTRGAAVEFHLTLRGTRKTAMVVTPDGTVLSFK